jgi:hypothetical protein
MGQGITDGIMGSGRQFSRCAASETRGTTKVGTGEPDDFHCNPLFLYAFMRFAGSARQYFSLRLFEDSAAFFLNRCYNE